MNKDTERKMNLLIEKAMNSSTAKSKEGWNKLYSSNRFNTVEYDGWLDKHLPILQKAETIIDLGCGNGVNALYLQKKDIDVLACDFSEVALQQLKQKSHKIKTFNFDMTDGIPFDDSYADVVIADLSLHYFSTIGTTRIINDIFRVLKADGILLCRIDEERTKEQSYDFKIPENEVVKSMFSDYKIHLMQKNATRKYGESKCPWELKVGNNEKNISIAKFKDIFKDVMSVDKLIDWLVENGFFTAPASRNHHGNYTGGLFDHSLAVTNKLVEMTNKMGIKWENPRSPYVVGMFHDLCKIDNYVNTCMVNRYPGIFKHNPDSTLLGHGDKSIILLSQLMTLTEEEILCIRYHMGAYEKGDWDYFDRAIKKYETVLWTHHADTYVSKVEGV